MEPGRIVAPAAPAGRARLTAARPLGLPTLGAPRPATPPDGRRRGITARKPPPAGPPARSPPAPRVVWIVGVEPAAGAGGAVRSLVVGAACAAEVSQAATRADGLKTGEAGCREGGKGMSGCSVGRRGQGEGGGEGGDRSVLKGDGESRRHAGVHHSPCGLRRLGIAPATAAGSRHRSQHRSASACECAAAEATEELTAAVEVANGVACGCARPRLTPDRTGTSPKWASRAARRQPWRSVQYRMTESRATSRRDSDGHPRSSGTEAPALRSSRTCPSQGAPMHMF
eukprot:scaffold12265_cov116-Isochrysis_galbana.AAC.3